MLEEMQRILFDHLVTDLLKILKTLDLRLEVRKTDNDPNVPAALAKKDDSKRSDNDDSAVSAQLVQSDLQSQMKPVVPKDFELYLNLVEFFRRFFLLIPNNADQESPLFSITTLDPVIHTLSAPPPTTVALAQSLSLAPGSLEASYSSSSPMSRLVSPVAPGLAAGTTNGDDRK
jgi:hypothetical protein